MKNLKRLFLLIVTSFALVSLAFAANTYNNKNTTDHKADNKMNKAHKLWVCETNASSSSNEGDVKNEEKMKKGISGRDAFAFALKHCRDCTKITCTMEENPQ